MKVDIIQAVRGYIDKILVDGSISGMKALLLDPLLTQVVSMVYSQTQILDQEVYLVETLGKRHEAMNHLKACVFCQPTEANVDLLIKELRDPQFAEYHIFFSNILSHDLLTRLGKADENEVVRQVQEYYVEYLAVNDDLFHLGIPSGLILSSGRARSIEAGRCFDKMVDGLLTVLLSLKRRPSQIRYQATSDLTKRMASEIVSRIERDDVFDFRRQEGPLLLILDRRDDPITPLLTQWTYQAMVHELLGLNNNRVSLAGAPGIREDLKEVVISATVDNFFAKHRFDNFGDLGVAVKQMLDDYQKHAKMNENITSIEDMQKFMERYPAFRSQSINVSKHVAVIGELSRLVDVCHLLDISALEQEIACGNDHGNHKIQLMEKLQNHAIQPADKVRLAILFAIRYESYSEVSQIKSVLIENGVKAEKAALIDAVLEYGGESQRAPGLFASDNIIGKLSRTITTSVGIDNVYTQHNPLLSKTLEAISKQKLKDSQYPSIPPGVPMSRTSEVIIFMVGGTTYEEALKVSEFNAANPNLRVILGGSCIQNSMNFLKEIDSCFGLGKI